MRSRFVVGLMVVLLGVGCAGAESPSTPQDLAAIAHWSGNSPTGGDAFRFVVLSDRTGGHVPGHWEEAVKEVNLLRPDFVMCVGDLIEGYTEDVEKVTAEWEEFDAIVAGLDAPFFYCSANHDATNDVMLKIWLERYGRDGKSYYSFDYRDCHFIVLDSQSANRVPEFAEAQLAWLRDDIEKAADAKHVFVFYHHPRMDNPANFLNMLMLLPAEKTTIFNGHNHVLSYFEQDGIPNIVLSHTGSGTNRAAEDLGNYRMFAHVTVDDGEPSISLATLHEIRSLEYAADVTAARGLVEGTNVGMALPEGGALTVTMKNPTEAPAAIELTWSGDDWKVSPASFDVTLDPDAEAEARFELTPLVDLPTRPMLTHSYKFTGPNGEPMEWRSEKRVPILPSLHIAFVGDEDLVLDGTLDDWAAVKQLTIDYKDMIFSGDFEGWSRSDLSAAVRAASDGQTLYLAFDVKDEQICDDGDEPWQNDAVELFWDARPIDQRNGKHGQNTGQVVFGIPAEGDQVVVKPYVGNPEVAHQAKTAVNRTKDGYTLEVAIPLAELGRTEAPKAGDMLFLQVQLDDRDRPADQVAPVNRFMSATGTGGSYANTEYYFPATFR